MPQIVQTDRDQFGLNGGTIVSGSIKVTADAFWYLPITNTVAGIGFANLSGVSGSNFTASFTAGSGVYGGITSVSQSSGIAILYSGSYYNV
jgi:hypothetical protein